MNSFGLLLGHLVGDYLFQTDWMAANKSNSHPGREPFSFRWDDVVTQAREEVEWTKRWKAHKVGFAACTVHCLFYTLAVALFSFWWMPWYGYLICFIAHWPIDR